MNKLILHTTRVTQNSEEFLLGVFRIADILSFTRYTEYTILGFDEENDNRPITNQQVQRKLNSSKVTEIANFLLTDPLAIFPTNLVVAIPGHVIDEIIENEENSVELRINEIVQQEIRKIDINEKGDIYLSVIDGQHRIKGIEEAMNIVKERIKEGKQKLERTGDNKYKKEVSRHQNTLDNLRNWELSVSFFIDPVLEYQAMIFSTINRTQTKVSPDLVYSLFGLTKDDSPQKTALNIVNILNGRDGSPFYKRVRLAGSGSKEAKDFYKGGNPVLSQAMMVKSILYYICKKNEADVERHKTREEILKSPNTNLPFRNFYGQNHDERILRIVYAYYAAVRKVFVDEMGNSYWEFTDLNKRKPLNILQTRIGYEALLMILKEILVDIPGNEDDSIDVYAKYLERAKDLDINDNNNPKKYPFASKTRNKFYNDLGAKIFGASFSPKPEEQ